MCPQVSAPAMARLFETLGVAALLLPTLAVTLLLPSKDQLDIAYGAAVAAASGLLTWAAIPGIRPMLLKAGLGGKDLGKKGTPRESVEV